MSRARRRFDYPRTGQGAPTAVRALVALVRRLPETQRGAQALWGLLLGPQGTPPYKMDPRDVAYTSPSRVPRQKCKNCQRFYEHPTTGIAICDSVQGRIYGPDGCDRWASPLTTAEYTAYQGGDARQIIRNKAGPVVGRPIRPRVLRFRPVAFALLGVWLGVSLNAWGQDPSVEVLTALTEGGPPSVYLWLRVIAEGGLPVVLALLLVLVARGLPLTLSFSEVDRELLRGLGRTGGRDG